MPYDKHHQQKALSYRGTPPRRSKRGEQRKRPENLSPEGARKRDAWLREVEPIFEDYKEKGVKNAWQKALKEASRRRKERNPQYLTVNEERNTSPERLKSPRNVHHYRERTRGYYRPPGPYRKKNKQPLGKLSAVKHLRKHYRDNLQKGTYDYGKNPPRERAHSALQSRVLRRKKSPQKRLLPCPYREITYQTRLRNGEVRTVTRRVPDKNKGCRDAWLYRESGVRDYEIEGVDDGNADSPALESDLYRTRKSDYVTKNDIAKIIGR